MQGDRLGVQARSSRHRRHVPSVRAYRPVEHVAPVPSSPAAGIHPTAVVVPGARLGAGCEVGAYSVVGEHVRLGEGCRIHAHVVLEGHTTLGPGCEVFPFACIGGQTQDLKWRGGTARVEIGARTTLREYVTVHASTADGGRTVVGNDCHLMAGSHLAHDCVVGDHVVISNGTQVAGHAVIEDHATLGGMSGVVQFVRVGRHAFVGGMAKVTLDVAPFTLCDGQPARPVSINRVGLLRRGFDPARLARLEGVYDTFFHAGLGAAEALAVLRARFPGDVEVEQFAAFVASARRGVARPSAGPALPVPRRD